MCRHNHGAFINYVMHCGASGVYPLIIMVGYTTASSSLYNSSASILRNRKVVKLTVFLTVRTPFWRPGFLRVSSEIERSFREFLKINFYYFLSFLGEAFFLAYSGSCMRPAAKKEAKKHTEHERVQFLGTTEHERGPYTHATRQKHTLKTRVCSFEYHGTREGA